MVYRVPDALIDPYPDQSGHTGVRADAGFRVFRPCYSRAADKIDVPLAGAKHIPHGDLPGRLRKAVSARSPPAADHKAAFLQLRGKLLQICLRQMLPLGDGAQGNGAVPVTARSIMARSAYRPFVDNFMLPLFLFQEAVIQCLILFSRRVPGEIRRHAAADQLVPLPFVVVENVHGVLDRIEHLMCVVVGE